MTTRRFVEYYKREFCWRAHMYGRSMFLQQFDTCLLGCKRFAYRMLLIHSRDLSIRQLKNAYSLINEYNIYMINVIKNQL